MYLFQSTPGSDDVFLVNYEANKVFKSCRACVSAIFGENFAFEKDFEISVKWQRWKFEDFLDVTSELGN